MNEISLHEMYGVIVYSILLKLDESDSQATIEIKYGIFHIYKRSIVDFLYIFFHASLFKT